MANDYLWDRSGMPDADVERLEHLLGRLRSAPPPLRLAKPTPRRHWRSVMPLLAAAAVLVVMVGIAWWKYSQPGPSWPVARMAGAPLIGTSTFGAKGRLAIGQTLTTDAVSRARIEVSSIGQVTIDANTSVRLVATETALHRLALDHGTINAFIQAPPGRFVVDTPSATATDLGCVYTLHVDDRGGGLLSVVAGWVAFESNGFESFVPAGASCRTDPGRGPGTPRFDDADARWREALDELDFGRDAGGRRAALNRVLDGARPRDSVTLWHLLNRVSADERRDVFAALAARVSPPQNVTADAVMRLDKEALDRWWDALGLGDTSLWRKWKGSYPGPAMRTKTLATSYPSECAVTPTIVDEPPRDPGASAFGKGPWYINSDRTIWVGGPWSAGVNKVLWIRPAGTDLKIAGRRVDAPAPPLEARIPCCYLSGFQVTGLTFPTEGCWEIAATAGTHELRFTTRVSPR